MDIVTNWLALLPEVPTMDEFGQPWALQYRRGMTPAQQVYWARRNATPAASCPAIAAQGEQVAAQLPQTSPGEGMRGPMIIKNGVLTDTHLYYSPAIGKLARRAIAAPGNLGEILQLALTYRLAAIWVYPGTSLSAAAGEAFNLAPGCEITRPVYGDTKTHPTQFVGGYKKREQRAQGESGETVFVGYPEHNSAWGLTGMSSPGALLFTTAYAEDALGFQLQYSPAAGGRRVISETNSGKRRPWIAPVDMRKYPPCCAENVRDLGWKRELSPEESAQAWLLAYDKNSQYASACTGAKLGTGEPIELHAPIHFDPEKLIPGVWRCKISGTSIFDGKQLPHPTDGKTEGYYWSYTVKLLLELGYTVEIDHAFIWEESHTILRPFAEQLWQSRAALGDRERYPIEEARVAAGEIVKATMNHCIGALNSRKYLKAKNPRLEWFRPDWRELLRDNSKYQMFRRILKNHEDGYKLIGAHVDCLYYASPEKDHARAIPDWLEKVNEAGEITRRAGLGGYKPKYPRDIPMSVARDWFNNPATSMETINSLLDAYCTEQAQATERN